MNTEQCCELGRKKLAYKGPRMAQERLNNSGVSGRALVAMQRSWGVLPGIAPRRSR